jgi:hypothetical protein
MKKLARFVLSVCAVALATAAVSSKAEAQFVITSRWVPESCCFYVTSPGTFERNYVYQNGQWVPTESTRCNPGICRA